MAPQSMSFIGDQDSVDLSTAHSMKIQQLFQPTNHNSSASHQVKVNTMHSNHGDSQSHLEASLGKLNISSGSRTYRIPSPTRPVMNSKSFQVSVVAYSCRIVIVIYYLRQDPNAEDEGSTEKGFYISFDNEAPKRPKPPLRTKRSPKKETSDTTSGQSSASTLDSGRSMNEMNDRFATTTRKSSINEMGSSPNHYSSERSFDEGRGSEPVPAKRHHITELGTGMMNVNENSYGYDVYQAQQQQQMVQPRKHLEDVTNYEPQQMHNLSYGSSPSEYGQGGMMMAGGGQELNGGGGGSIRTNHNNSEGTAKPIIIANSNLDPVSGNDLRFSRDWS